MRSGSRIRGGASGSTVRIQPHPDRSIRAGWGTVDVRLGHVVDVRGDETKIDGAVSVDPENGFTLCFRIRWCRSTGSRHEYFLGPGHVGAEIDVPISAGAIVCDGEQGNPKLERCWRWFVCSAADEERR